MAPCQRPQVGKSRYRSYPLGQAVLGAEEGDEIDVDSMMAGIARTLIEAVEKAVTPKDASIHRRIGRKVESSPSPLLWAKLAENEKHRKVRSGGHLAGELGSRGRNAFKRSAQLAAKQTLVLQLKFRDQREDTHDEFAVARALGHAQCADKCPLLVAKRTVTNRCFTNLDL